MLRVKTFSASARALQENAAMDAEAQINRFLEENPDAIIYNGQLSTMCTAVGDGSADNPYYYDFTITALFNLPDPK